MELHDDHVTRLCLQNSMNSFPEWRLSPGLLSYSSTLSAMEERVTAIYEGRAAEQFWLLQHPPLYTAGTSARLEELLDPERLPVFQTGRGGRYTYHGPGQRVVYVMLNLAERGRDLRRFVAALENWIILALGDLGVEAYVIPGKVGVWVKTCGGEAKIAAIGVRVRRWVSFHGIAINIDPDLENYAGIQPCGLLEPVTSLRSLGKDTEIVEVDEALKRYVEVMLDAIGLKIT